MRVLEPALELGREALVLARSFGERARQPPGDRVEQHHRRQLAAGEDVRADRDRVGREVRDDPLVEALEARREERQRRLGGELLDDGLRQRPPLRRQRDHPLLGRLAVDGVERGRDDVDAQHHPGAAAVGLVVDLAGAQRRRVAVVEEPQLELGAENGGERPLLGHPRECVRNLGEDVETQSRSRLLVGVREAAGDEDPARVEVDVEHAALDERQQQAGVEREHVVGGTVLHLGDSTERAAAFLLDGRPTSWKT